uniref:Uncharacterized protein n=1 Tax=Trichobilharzia regenti TaxID=157069 RepID=A0AA85JFU7_TRIRE|nr:unnamed protein product [Trichobilharzia regenti]
MFRMSILFFQQIVLWSATICFMCCKTADFNCYFLLGFVILEDVLTVIACIYFRRFKLVVMIVLISLSVAFLITGTVLFYLDLILVFVSLLK